MKKYICSVCGYIYDEASGYPEGNIPPGTVWADVPSSFVCPLCGASKADFNEKEDDRAKTSSSTSDSHASLPEDISYTAAELSAVFSNLAKGCEKQYDSEMADLYKELAAYYNLKSEKINKPDLESLESLLQNDLSTHFALANDVAAGKHDRGALRALKWAEKVSLMIRSLLNKVESGKADFLKEKNVYVCDICGFIYVGDEKPEICPVCKVPGMKMTQVGRSA
ncbi:MAG: rubredoxin [Spirochaetales bacterium]|nr:rubredoxin [Spirochaetales bacterium]